MVQKTRHIRVYFDFACPFCYNEWNFMKKVRMQVPIEEEYYSWEIHPGVSEDGEIISYPGFEKNAALLNELGAPVGVAPGNMRKVFNTRKALQLLEEAKKQKLQLEFMDAVFYAYFEEQRNVGKTDIILDIAKQVGLEGAEAVLHKGLYLDTILEHDKHCMDMGLEYVPTLEENGEIILSGVLSLQDVEKEFIK